MKVSKIIMGLFILITLMAINSLVINVSAQETGKCTATAKNIYFVDSGRVITEVHPGSNGGNGYQLNILKWEMTFAVSMGRIIPTIKMKNKCTGETKAYKLDGKIKLLDQ